MVKKIKHYKIYSLILFFFILLVSFTFADEGDILVSNTYSDSWSYLNSSDGYTEKEYNTPGSAMTICANNPTEENRYIYVGTGGSSNVMAIYNASDNYKNVRNITIPGPARGSFLNQETGDVWLVLYQTNLVVFFDADKNYNQTNYTVNDKVYDIYVNHRTRDVWIAYMAGNNITMLNYSDGYSQKDFVVGSIPKSIWVNENTNDVWIANSGSSTITMLNYSDDYARTDYPAVNADEGICGDVINGYVYSVGVDAGEGHSKLMMFNGSNGFSNDKNLTDVGGANMQISKCVVDNITGDIWMPGYVYYSREQKDELVRIEPFNGWTQTKYDAGTSNWDIWIDGRLYYKSFPFLTIILDSPTNTTHTNDNTTIFMFNVSTNLGNVVANCTLYINDTYYGGKNINLSENKTFNITNSPELEDNIYYWFVNCTYDNTVYYSKNFTITIDTHTPQIHLFYPSNDNATIFDYNVNKSFNISANFTDSNLYETLVNITNSSQNLWMNYTTNITGNYHYINLLVNITDWSIGEYIIELSASDDHTNSEYKTIILNDNNVIYIKYENSTKNVSIEIGTGNSTTYTKEINNINFINNSINNDVKFGWTSSQNNSTIRLPKQQWMLRDLNIGHFVTPLSVTDEQFYIDLSDVVDDNINFTIMEDINYYYVIIYNKTIDPVSGGLNVKTEYYSFRILDSSAPTFSNNITWGLKKIYTNYSANVTIKDNYQLDYSWIESNHTGILSNYSFKDISGVEYGFTTSLNITLSRGKTIKLRFCANDTYSNLDCSDYINFTVVNTNATITNITVKPIPPMDCKDMLSNYTVYDRDDDSIIDFILKWYKYNTTFNDEIEYLENTTNITSGNLTISDGWNYTITVFDGYDWSPISSSGIHYIDGCIQYIYPTPENNSRHINNLVYVNVSLYGDYDDALDLCLLNWNGTNETMYNYSNICYMNKTTIDNKNYTFYVFANTTTGKSYTQTIRYFTENTQPYITNMNYTPYPLYPNTSFVNVTYMYNDDENDKENGTVYQWYGNGSLLSGQTNRELTNVYYSSGDNLTIVVVPSDGYEYGNSSNITFEVLYAPPSVTNINITPQPLSKLNGTATGIYNFTAENNDDQSYYRWFVNNDFIGITTINVSNTYFKKNDNLTFKVIPYDGIQNGSQKNITITNLPNIQFSCKIG